MSDDARNSERLGCKLLSCDTDAGALAAARMSGSEARKIS